MKKQLLKSALIAVAGIGLLAGSALASPMYWTLTDGIGLGYSESLNILLSDTITTANNEFSFGIFYDFNGNNSIESNEKFQIFATTAETGAIQSIFFKEITGSVYASLNAASGYVLFDSTTWGYYFDKAVGGISLYTDSQYNTPGGVWSLNVSEINPVTWNFSIYKDQGRTEVVKMQVISNDISPIPEPTTMLLLGTGIVGLAGFARKRKSN